MDTFVIVNLLIMLIIIVAAGIDAYRNQDEYKTWRSYVWIALLLL